MVETLLNGRLDAWWEIVILVIIGFPFWFPIIQVLALLSLKVVSFTLSFIYRY